MIEGRNTIKIDGVECSIEALAMLFKTLDGAFIRQSDGRVIYAKRQGDEFVFKVLKP